MKMMGSKMKLAKVFYVFSCYIRNIDISLIFLVVIMRMYSAAGDLVAHSLPYFVQDRVRGTHNSLHGVYGNTQIRPYTTVMLPYHDPNADLVYELSLINLKVFLSLHHKIKVRELPSLNLLLNVSFAGVYLPKSSPILEHTGLLSGPSREMLT